MVVAYYSACSREKGKKKRCAPRRLLAPAPCRRVRINQLVSSRGTERRTRLKKTLKPLWNAGAARCLTCSESLCERRLRLSVPKFLFHADRMIKLLLRLRSQVQIGVRAAGKTKTNEEKSKRKRPKNQTSTSANKPYDLTNHLHSRSPHLTPSIGVR